MAKSKIPPFRIRNRIDMGTDGRFDAGAEAHLRAKLDEMKNGEKEFQRLLNRGALVLEQPKKVEVSKNVASESKSKGKGEDEDEELPSFEPADNYRAEHYGGGNYYIVTPEGEAIETVTQSQGGKDAAQARVNELNGETE